MIYDIFQLVGGLILAFGYIPQIIQIIRTRSARDLNLQTFILVFIGIFLMELYAFNLLRQGVGGAFFITNTVSLITAGVMLSLVVIYKDRGSQNARRNEGADD